MVVLWDFNNKATGVTIEAGGVGFSYNTASTTILIC